MIYVNKWITIATPFQGIPCCTLHHFSVAHDFKSYTHLARVNCKTIPLFQCNYNKTHPSLKTTNIPSRYVIFPLGHPVLIQQTGQSFVYLFQKKKMLYFHVTYRNP